MKMAPEMSGFTNLLPLKIQCFFAYKVLALTFTDMISFIIFLLKIQTWFCLLWHSTDKPYLPSFKSDLSKWVFPDIRCSPRWIFKGFLSLTVLFFIFCVKKRLIEFGYAVNSNILNLKVMYMTNYQKLT